MKKNFIKISEPNHFIGAWNINDGIMSEIIDYFNSSHESHEVTKLASGLLDKNKRDSIQLSVTPKEIEKNNLTFFKNYLLEIKKCLNDYNKEWDLLSHSLKKSYISKISIEKFLISGHHIDYHFARLNISSSHKVLTWITLLDDVKENEGSTEFKYLDCNIQPKKGLTIIFPSDWTHAHRQNILKTQEKFILHGNIQFSEID